MEPLIKAINEAVAAPGPLVFLTGAGVSAESDIPTFRGEDGYWTSASKRYHPQELATRHAFSLIPEVVWSWYLWRLAVCSAAQPNAAHRAIAQAACLFGDRLLLITQNVDGLHGRAGSPAHRTYEVHGNIAWMRCNRGCPGLFRVPFLVAHPEGFSELTAEERGALVCPHCGAQTRPHVLWFDETYNEPLYRFQSSLQAASDAALLIVVGTTGATNLPLQIGNRVAERGVPMVVINPEPNPFSEMAQRSPHGVFLRGTAGQWMPEVLDGLAKAGGASQSVQTLGAGHRATPVVLPCLIIELFGEGIQVTLEGMQDSASGWRYRVRTNARLLAELAPAYQSFARGNDRDNAAPPELTADELCRQGDWVETWEAAMKELDRCSWVRLWPGRIDRAFAWRVLQEVRARMPTDDPVRDSRRWMTWCQQAAEPA